MSTSTPSAPMSFVELKRAELLPLEDHPIADADFVAVIGFGRRAGSRFVGQRRLRPHQPTGSRRGRCACEKMASVQRSGRANSNIGHVIHWYHESRCYQLNSATKPA